MSLYVHHLAGCAPTPLAHYLKALGILRLVAEQKDPTARGWWQDESFHLATTLSREELERFFLEEYAPTPIIAPWNKGSGFVFADNNPALGSIAESTSDRLQVYRKAVGEARTLVAELSEADRKTREIKAETKQKGMSKTERERLKDSPEYKVRLASADRAFKSIKEGLIPLCRRQWRGPQQQWLDAALVLTADNEAKYPALLGSGGNDGKNDFTKQYMESLCAAMNLQSGKPADNAKERLSAALFKGATPEAWIEKLPVGQFLPALAGGANMGNGPDANAAGNPWDYVLLIEGTLVLISSVTRKITQQGPNMAAAPFAIHAMATGYGSASAKEGDARGEQWMPLWDQPCTLDDLRHLMAEGRAQLGSAPASRPVDFARAVARLGVARGITAFQRFGYLERNGQANLAVPLGRWRVTPQPRQELLDDLDRFVWLNRLQRVARDKNVPASLAAVHRRVEDAVMAVCASGGESGRWQTLLLALAEIERQMVCSGKFTAERRMQPIPPLSGGWVAAADDGSPEFRLALALALQGADEYGLDSIRGHWLPMKERGTGFATDSGGLTRDPRVVCHGLDTERDLIALVQRRLIEGGRGANTRLPLIGPSGFEAHPADVAAFLNGDLDLEKLGGLARAFMALNRRAKMPLPRRAKPSEASEPPPLYGLFRLACLPWPLRRGAAEIPIRCDPAIVIRLAAGDWTSAGDTAIRRLKAAGLVPVIRHVAGDDAALARRLATSLAFPISMSTAVRLADCLTKPEISKQKGSAA